MCNKCDNNSCSCNTTRQIINNNNSTGRDGESAYDIAVRLGYLGTEEQWNAEHMSGPIGPRGPMGPIGPRGLNGINGSNGINGAPGINGSNGLQGIPGIPGQNGRDGRDGVDGVDGTLNVSPGFEVRFAVNGSTTSPPLLINTTRIPEGWTIEQPVLGIGEYLWIISARIKSDDTLLTNWSTPARLSGAQGPPGSPGAIGATGPAGAQGPKGEPGENGGGPGSASPYIVPRGEWINTGQYYGTPNRIDIVSYGGIYYVARVDAGEIPIGTLPTNLNYYNAFDGQYDNIATGLLLAQAAYIGYLQSNSLFVAEPGFPVLRGWELGGEAIESIQKRADNITPKTKLTSDGKIDTIDATIAGTLKVQGDDLIEVGNVAEGESGFTWDKVNGLKLRGAILQDTSGAKIVIPRFRGAYGPGTVYIEGDQVTEAGSSYIAIFASPFSAIAVTNTTYWQVIAEKGIDGGGAGPAGPAGPNYVRKYAKNGSTVTSPIISEPNSPTGPGVGWSTTIPTTTVGEYVWASEAKFESDGVTMIGTWSIGFRLTGIAGTNGTNGTNGVQGPQGFQGNPGTPGINGTNGTNGANGPAGPSLAYRGVWNAGNTYKGTSNIIEVVGYGSLYYMSRVDAGTFTSSTTPNLDTARWNVFGSVFESVATSILFAELAYINNLGVRYLKTSETSTRLEIDGFANNFKLIKNNVQKVLIDDDCAILGYTFNDPVFEPFYGAGIFIGNISQDFTSISEVRVDTKDVYATRRIVASAEIQTGTHIRSGIATGANILGEKATYLVSANCSLNTNPSDGMIQTIKNTANGNINLYSDETAFYSGTSPRKIYGLNNGLFNNMTLGAGNVFSFQYFQASDWWVQIR